ncbi:hypothetical protein [Nitrosomonas ureae]|uniref:Uncharacterized protein n=1 Tax=Nitrosomonas ureae TaxID=44577 RepID=A0A286AAY2_9PROT|nr:hypothetical protein [Nitrosomonas ureae]SOD19064.1 hypothetical protein SAMN06297164_2020 [Nitrosomonas ureae]
MNSIKQFSFSGLHFSQGRANPPQRILGFQETELSSLGGWVLLPYKGEYQGRICAEVHEVL